MIKRLFKIALFFVVALVTLVVLAVTIFSFQGRREWERTKRDLIVKGERLSLAEFQRPPVADEDNVFADPLWESGNLFSTRLGAEERTALERLFPEFAPLTEKTSASDIRTLAEKGSELSRSRAGELMLLLQKPAEKTLARIDELSRRPAADGGFDPSDPATMRPRPTSITSVAYVLSLRCWALLQQGRTDEAFETLDVLHRLSAKYEDRLLVGYLINTAVFTIYLETVEIFLAGGGLTDAQLAHLQEQLQGVDRLARYRQAIRSERAYFNSMSEALARSDYRSLPGGEEAYAQSWSFVWFQRAIYNAHDQARYNQIVQRLVDLSGEADRGINARDPFLGTKFPKLEKAPFHQRMTSFASLMVGPHFIRLLRNALETQVRVNEVITVCGLMRYRLKIGKYPETLAALVPEYLARVPLDPASGEPLHYRLEGPDKFTLWSVGWNGVDDGAKVGRDGVDWVWGKSWRPWG